MNFNSNPSTEKKNIPVSEFTFNTLLDETCERLLDRQVKYSILRIHELEKRLARLECELDEFMQVKR
ncbi:MAG: hypothetical protein FWG89_03720 [Treponema sp.]|nr:hypothetical protein [Treponema sp.]